MCEDKKNASTGNRTRATCLEGRNSNHWTIDARQQQDSNLRGQSPPDFKSGALTTRPYWQYMTAISGLSVGGSTFPCGGYFLLRFCRGSITVKVFHLWMYIRANLRRRSHTFSAFWLRSSVVSVLISLISDTVTTVLSSRLTLFLYSGG